MRPVPDPGPDEGMHERFSRVARTRPDAIALVENDRRVTYGELDMTADAWAAELAVAGVGPGCLVPILLPRSCRLVTALLAVLKTGAAYALLDPCWPARRRAEIFADLRTPLQITDVEHADGPPGWSPPDHTVAPTAFEPVPVSGSSPCCVFFTSGTTGRPKGVLSPHRATARLFPPDTFARFTTDTVMPLAAAVPWDAFSLELWSVLLNGGTSVLVSDEPYLSAGALRAHVARHGVNTLWLTASLFNMIVDEDSGAFAGLRQVMIGGERLSPDHVARFLDRHPGVTLINGYGPVESTVFATTHVITPADCRRPGGIPLGRAVPGTGIHVLDGDRPCASGETGEICVSGDGLALRYLGDAALTEAKFPRLTLDGRSLRVYRTGDLGQWDADGTLRYCGRVDRQIKIRGHRVESAEVERQIERALPEVRSCRVVARADDAGTVQDLLAFCVPVRAGDPLSGAMPRLRTELATFHVPSAVVSLERFPVNANGKLDERALLTLADRPAVSRTSAEPVDDKGRAEGGDPVTRMVAAVFGEVLGTTAIPYDVPFVELGGSSLAAGQVCARLSARLSLPFPVSRLYQHPTVDGLSRWLRAAPDAPPAPAATTEIPLTPTQIAFMTRRQLDPADLTGTCFLSWLVEGDLDRTALQTAIDETHRWHEALRAVYLLDPRPEVFLDDVPPPELEILPAEPTTEAALVTAQSALTGDLSPELGLVWRTVLVPVTARKAVFACAVHHVAFDGWSESVLARSITAAYERSVGGRPETPSPPTPSPPTPSPPTLAQAHHAATARLAAADLTLRRESMVRELARVPALTWPSGDPGHPPGAIGREIGRAEEVLLPADAARLRALALRHGTSLFSVLLSAWARSLADVVGQDDFALGLPVAQRDSITLEQAIGCHITMLCVRLRGSALDDGAPVTAAKATEIIVRRALAAQDVPLADILDELGRREPPRSSLYQALFALQNNTAPRLPLRGLRTTFVRRPYQDLPLDLHAELWPTEDGGIRVAIDHRRPAVPETTARDLLKGFVERLSVIGEL